MTIQQFETDIINRIGTFSDTVIVNPLPELDTEKVRAIDEKPVLYVGYKNSDYFNAGASDRSDYLRSTDIVSQEEIIYVDIIFIAKKLRGALGIYDLYDKVRSKLVGFIPSNCHKLHMVSFAPTEKDQENFLYVMTMRCISLIVELGEDPETPEPNLTQVTFNTTVPT